MPTPKKKRASWRKFIPYAIGAGILAFIVTGLLPKPIVVDTAVVGAAPLTVSVLEEGKTRIRHRYVVSPPVRSKNACSSERERGARPVR